MGHNHEHKKKSDGLDRGFTVNYEDYNTLAPTVKTIYSVVMQY